MKHTTTKDAKTNKPLLGMLLGGSLSLKMRCPLCDTRRSEPCKHPNILTHKGDLQ